MDVLKTKYLGLDLPNPIIVSSSGLTNSVEKIVELEKAGAGAVVLKSLFEEQINFEAGTYLNNSPEYPEAEDYILAYSKSNSLSQYLKVIEESKKAVSIPVIASINCISDEDWLGFAKKIEQFGADALEINMHIVTTDIHTTSKDIEDVYLTISDKVSKSLNIPVVAKIGYHFSNLSNMANRLQHRGLKGLVLFNRFYQPDIDINNLSFNSASIFSSPDDIRNSLRWIGIISANVKDIDISASTGVHDAEAAIKMILAGATTVQVCSTIYNNGNKVIGEMLGGIKEWMSKHNFSSLHDFRGKMSYKNIDSPRIYERAQFMKYFSNHI